MHVTLNMENNRTLLCKYFSLPYRKSNDIQRQFIKTIGIDKAVN